MSKWQQWKWVIGAFVLIYLLGLGTGGLLSLNYQNVSWSKLWNYSSDPTEMTQRMKKHLIERYQLTPEQMTRIEPAIAEITQRLYALRKEYGAATLQALDAYHEKIEQEMTTEQRAQDAERYAKRKAELAAQLTP